MRDSAISKSESECIPASIGMRSLALRACLRRSQSGKVSSCDRHLPAGSGGQQAIPRRIKRSEQNRLWDVQSRDISRGSDPTQRFCESLLVSWGGRVLAGGFNFFGLGRRRGAAGAGGRRFSLHRSRVGTTRQTHEATAQGDNQEGPHSAFQHDQLLHKR